MFGSRAGTCQYFEPGRVAGAREGGRAWGVEAVFSFRHKRLGSFFQTAVAAGLGAAALLLSVSAASAQGNFFDSLFGGRRWNGPTAFADPFSQWFGSRPAEAPRVDTGGGVAYCVRLCDGRFFPIQRHSSVSTAQACSSFCPASQTRIYNGSSIDNAAGPDGKRYADLSTAFAFREKIVPGCTCNGKDAFGLVNTPIEDDQTLQAGDIVATNGGLMAYNGNAGVKRQNFTPVSSYAGLSSDLRRKLTETKIAPAPQAAPAPTKPADATDATGSIRNGKNKRVQLSR